MLSRNIERTLRGFEFLYVYNINIRYIRYKVGELRGEACVLLIHASQIRAKEGGDVLRVNFQATWNTPTVHKNNWCLLSNAG